MASAIVTYGMMFGDEGKGTTVDALVRMTASKLVVRYSGGCQAGHNVVLPDGRHHTFSQFGAGTLAGANTFLGPEMIIDPESMVNEADHLQEVFNIDPWETLAVSPECLVTNCFQIIKNRILEEINRHGSCGMGIGATREYYLKYGNDSITAYDLVHSPEKLVAKLQLTKDRVVHEVRKQPIREYDGTLEMLEELITASPRLVADRMCKAAARMRVNKQPDADWLTRPVIFEGAQGLLLDQNVGFHPYTTWSDVSPRPAYELCLRWGIEDVTTYGITRAYSTRHGAGPFPANNFPMHNPAWEKEHCDIPGADSHNSPNYQGHFRAGPLDLPLLQYSINAHRPDGIIVTCLDQLPPGKHKVIREYAPAHGLFKSPQYGIHLQAAMGDALMLQRNPKVEVVENVVDEIEALGVPVVITSYGNTYQSKGTKWLTMSLGGLGVGEFN